MVEERGFINVAAEACGIHRHTAENWRDRGLEGDARYADFAVNLLRAKAIWMQRMLGAVEDPRWLLERADVAFRPPARLEHSGPDGGPMQHQHAVANLSDAELLRLVQGQAPVVPVLPSGDDDE
jgi:hypothetical protein